ncbi:THAP-type domain-containing protein [Trichonephila clavipes]|nr:THAP-type domain-containing protein [Trichonephila clavipes]
MVMCGMIGCSNRSGRDRVSFYRLPGTQRAADPAKKDLQLLRRAVWLTRICREDIVKDEKKLRHFRICNRHFIKNVPAALKDINDPDWAPTLFLGHNYFKPRRNGDKKKSLASLVVRASISKSEGLGSMPPNTSRVHAEFVFFKSVGGRSRNHGCTGSWSTFLSPPVLCLNCGGGVAIYGVEVQPVSGNFHSFSSGKTRQQHFS